MSKELRSEIDDKSTESLSPDYLTLRCIVDLKGEDKKEINPFCKVLYCSKREAQTANPVDPLCCDSYTFHLEKDSVFQVYKKPYNYDMLFKVYEEKFSALIDWMKVTDFSEMKAEYASDFFSATPFPEGAY